MELCNINFTKIFTYMRHLIDLLTGLLIGGPNTGTGAAILLNLLVAVLVATADDLLVTEDCLAGVVELGPGIADAVGVGADLVADTARPLADDGCPAGV